MSRNREETQEFREDVERLCDRRCGADENPYDFIVTVPEPGLIMQLVAGIAGLLALGRFRSRASYRS
jgi:hypothetical protein